MAASSKRTGKSHDTRSTLVLTLLLLARMLRTRFVSSARGCSRSYVTASPPHALVFLEHRNGVLDSGSLSALTAAHGLGGKVTGLVIGSEEHVPGIVNKAKKYFF
jgi:electron transfer flavoprotein alpha subunit